MSRRRPAFDPTRLDDLDDLLPTPSVPATPPSAAPNGAPAAAPSAAPEVPTPTGPDPDQGRGTAPAAAAPARRSAEPPAPRQARGQGGRPTRARTAEPRRQPETADPGRVPVAVRIPRTLYDDINTRLLAGPERPSYGQLVIWTCEDHPDEVAAEVRAARPQPGSRRPRGRRLAADTVQVTLRLTLEERNLVDDIGDTVRSTHPGLVTRTEIATAALRLALDADPSSDLST
ncbi:hypothetical protein [Pseudonocardia acidicola]|uniref:Uncharacterized protein n=1 Tax=Pseudonocardia acidicola TaxID=2724939 RepID=A0ABX1SID5_9PSEU|nr:hypothetical protein [Pseudonocardia acidicola]NMI01350.1 hypothetical protein [Pseudonocardia acidicola]